MIVTKELRVKKLFNDAQLPIKKDDGDAAFDLYSYIPWVLRPNEWWPLPTGISLEIPFGYAGFVWPRSGMSANHGLDVLAGVVDSNYRGEINVVLNNTGIIDYIIEKGDRVGQIVIQQLPFFEVVEVEELSDTERGEDGFGSSGK